MFEKLVLAATITFSLNICLHIREPGGQSAEMQQPNNSDTSPAILVRLPKDQRPLPFEYKN